MSQIRLAVVGCGGMSRAHARGFDELADKVAIKALVDVEEEKARAAAEHFPGAVAATDYHDVLDDVDAALLVLPHHLHHPVTIDCLKAGKHVLVEKPMANSEEECQDMIRCADETGQVLMVAYCMRFHPLVVRMKELLDEKLLGDVFQVSMWTEQHTQFPPDSWASDHRTLGGGQLFSHGCHYIDLLLWYLGEPVRGTHLGTNYGTPWMDWEGTSNVSMEFASGCLAYHFGTWGAKGSRLRYSFHAHCTEGMLEADITGGRLLSHVGGEEKVLATAEPGKHTQNELSHFVDCIHSGERPLTDGPRSLQSLRVIWRMYEAERNNVVADLRGLGLDEA